MKEETKKKLIEFDYELVLEEIKKMGVKKWINKSRLVKYTVRI